MDEAGFELRPAARNRKISQESGVPTLTRGYDSKEVEFNCSGVKVIKVKLSL
jgi:hypothetical protein